MKRSGILSEIEVKIKDEDNILEDKRMGLKVVKRKRTKKRVCGRRFMGKDMYKV